MTRSNKHTSKWVELYLRHQDRLNKKLTLSENTNLSVSTNDRGFATIANDSVCFALRKRNTVENIFTVKYNFNNKMGLSFRARHYWSAVENQRFFNLNTDGGMAPVSHINSDVNYNVNYFNIDMVYTWQFALGSFVNVVWKNSAGTFDQNIAEGYFKNARTTLDAPQLNSLSVRVIYFLDYLALKKK